MIHDKFCDYAGLETMGEPCWQCAAIEQARADEREQAARRMWNADFMCNDCQIEAETAIRGGEQA